MAVFKCKMCGGALEIAIGTTVIECDYCGTQQTLPKLDDERRANMHGRANHFRRNNEFDKAMGIYEQILGEDSTDAETYWSLVLCRYGIEYVEDPVSHRRMPTINRAQYTAIYDDDNYKSALQYADAYQKAVYEEEAKVINDIQKGILEISQKEEPFDVFICYKENDAVGKRTPDSVLANDLYHQLTQEGFKVFFARITLEEKLGSAYEPYIFAALNSAKVMVVLGTKPEYFNAVWVKNEWSRFLGLIKQGKKKTLIPAYKNMDAYDLPDEFSHLQAQDMSKLGFMQDLIRGIKKITQRDENKAKTAKGTSANNLNIAPLLERAFMFLEDGEWQEADEYCEKVLDQEPRNARAYLGKLMAELYVKKPEELQEQLEPFHNNKNYKKATRFADEKLKAELLGYTDYVINKKLNTEYSSAIALMNVAKTEDEYKKASEKFQKLNDFGDAKELATKCLKLAEETRVTAIYKDAVQLMDSAKTENEYRLAANRFDEIKMYKDSAALSKKCLEKADETRTTTLYDKALFKMNSAKGAEDYKKAAELFQEIKMYKDAILRSEECLTKANESASLEKLILELKAINKNEKSIEEKKNDLEAKVKILDEVGTELDKLLKSFPETEQELSSIRGQIQSLQAEETELQKEKESLGFLAIKRKMEIEETVFTIQDDIEGLQEKEATLIQNMKGFESMEDLTKAIDKVSDEAAGYKETLNELLSAPPKREIIDKLNQSELGKKLLDEYEKTRNIAVGYYMKFGTYNQDNDQTNGQEELEWLVLEVKDDKALLLSKYALYCLPYNTSYASVTWETSSLRKWLNSNFVEQAFSNSEKAKIATVTIPADKNPQYNTFPGNPTQDSVFLLSANEVNKYLASVDARQCTPTKYATESGAYVDGETGNCWWWLRTPGVRPLYASYIDYDGDVLDVGAAVDDYGCCVRPALWIFLE